MNLLILIILWSLFLSPPCIFSKRASDSVIPTSPDGKLTFQPPVLATLFVAAGLIAFTAVTLLSGSFFQDYIDSDYTKSGNYFIAFLFILRSVGDFKFVGFSKKIKHTKFAINDRKIYTPLCCLILFNSFLLVFLALRCAICANHGQLAYSKLTLINCCDKVYKFIKMKELINCI